MDEKVEKTKRKRIGAFIRYCCSEELNLKLEYLAEYQENNNISKIDMYYTANYKEMLAFYNVIRDIFEKRIDTLLVVGDFENLTSDCIVVERIAENVELIKV